MQILLALRCSPSDSSPSDSRVRFLELAGDDEGVEGRHGVELELANDLERLEYVCLRFSDMLNV